MSRHSDPRYFLLGSIPGEEDKVITGSRLPTVRQVLFNFLAFHSNDSKITVRDAANITVSNVIPFYERARVPHLPPNKMAEEVIKIYEDMRSLMKIDHVQRSNNDTKKKRINDFKDKLEKTLKLWPRNAFDKMKNKEDKQFLQSMMSDRVASMGQVDKVLSKTEDKVAKRKYAEQERLEIEKKRVNSEEKKSSESLQFEGNYWKLKMQRHIEKKL